MIRFAFGVIATVLAAGVAVETQAQAPARDRLLDQSGVVREGAAQQPGSGAGSPGYEEQQPGSGAGSPGYGEQQAAPAEGIPLTLRDCVERALEYNAQPVVAQYEVAMRDAQAGQARSKLLPQLKGRFAYTYVDGLEDIITNPFLQRLLPVNGLQPENGATITQVSLDQVLYAGGRIQAGIRASEYLVESETWKKQSVIDQLVFEVHQAYYDALLAQALVEVARDSVGTFDRHREDALELLEAGYITRFEVLRAETELGMRRADLESALSLAEISRMNLSRLLVLPQDQPLHLSGDLAWEFPETPVDADVAQALENRPELRALDRGVEAAHAVVQVKQGAFKPSAAASARWQNVDGGGKVQPDGWTFSVGAELELYAGGRRKHEVAESTAQQRSLEAQHEDVARLVEFDVRQARAKLNEAVARIRTEDQTLTLAEEALRLATLRFQEGAGTQTETLDTELALSRAKTALAKALRDYAVAVAALDKATGKTWPGGAMTDAE